MIEAEYLIETPFDLEQVAASIAGEQSSGTFVRVANETDELRERAAAQVISIQELAPVTAASLPNAYLEQQGVSGPYRRAKVKIGFPEKNISSNLPTLAATVTGNLYDMGELTGLRLTHLSIPKTFRSQFAYPTAGISGTRKLLDVAQRPLFGTIVKPNLGMTTEQIADLVELLCEAGIDFIKDDEVCSDPVHAPISLRIPAVMDRIRRYRERSGRDVMMAFNISDETDAMKRHAELIRSEQGSCAMVSMNWVGLSSMQTLRDSTDLVLHGHRNGFGGFSRHPALGISAQPYQLLYRLAGVDHMHVHGIGGKFCDNDDEVAAAARDCCQPLCDGETEDTVLPVFSSGQWAGTIPATYEAIQTADFMFLSGGGIIGHPDGTVAGVSSLHQAWEAVESKVSLEQKATQHSELRHALEFYGRSD